MKRILLFCIFLSVCIHTGLFAQCTCVGDDKWPTSTVTVVNDGLTKTINTAIFAGDTTWMTGFQDKTYTFSSNVITDYQTIRQTWPGLACSVVPLNYTYSGASGTYFLITNTNAACELDPTSRTTYYTCVDCVTAPANDDCGGAISLTPSGFGTCTGTAGSVAGATQSQAACLGGSTADDDVWYSFVATQTIHNVVLSSVTWDMVTEVFSGTCGSLASIACSDPDITSLSGLTIGDTYYVRVHSKSAWQRGTFNICIASPPPPPANDNCAGAVALTVNADLACGTTTAGTTVGATQSTETNPSCNASGIDDDVWYTFTATGAQQTIVLSGAATNACAMAVYTGSCGGLTQLAGACASTTSGTATLNLGGLTNGTVYTIRVWTTSTGVTQTFTLCVGTPPPPPANDECSGAIALTVNADLACGTTTSANTANATQSTETSPSCSATGVDDDIWYSFVAAGTKHTLVLSSASVQMSAAVYSGSCGSLTQLSGACASTTSGTVTMTIVGLTNGTTYRVRVFTTAASGNGTVTLCLGTPPVIPADDCSNPIDLAGETSPYSGTTVGATSDFNLITGCNNTAPDKLYTINVANNNVLHIGQTVNNYDSRTWIAYSGACPGTTQIACFDDSDLIKTKWLNNTGSSQLVNYVQDGHLSNSGTFTLAWLNVPQEANDECAGAVSVSTSASGACSYTTYSTSGGTKSTGNPACTSTDNDEDVWFTFTTGAAGAYIVRYNNLTATFGTAATMGIDLYTGACGSLAAVGGACNNALGSGGTGSATITLAASTTYTLRMWFTGNTTQDAYGVGTFGLCVEQPSACPVPSALTSGTITGISAILNWTENGSATTWDISYGVAPLADPNTGTIISGITKPYNLMGLTGSTTYDWYVRAICGGTPSAWSSKATFSTLLANDNCSGATAFGTIVVGGACTNLTNQTTTGATNSNVTPTGACASNSGTTDDDVWFSFVAPTTTVILEATWVSGLTDVYWQVFSGTCASTMTAVLCTDTNSGGTITGLTVGATYYIRLYTWASSGSTTQNICLKTPANMAYVSSTVGAQTSTSVGAGSVDASIVRLDVVVSGQLNPLSVTSFTCSTNGSTSPVTNNVVTGKVYYTGTSTTFVTTTLVGSVAIAADGSFTITGNQALTGGVSNTTNYFWLAYDIKCGAVNANVVDGEFNSVTVGGTPYTPTVQAPALNRAITALVSYDTKANGNFSDPNTWACGVPVGGNTVPIIIAHNVTLDANFVQDASLTVNASRTLTIGANTLSIGSSVATPTTQSLTIAGTVNVSGGTLNVGTLTSTTLTSNVSVSSGGALNISSGTMNVGPSGGYLRTLSVSGTLNVSSTGTLNHNGSVVFNSGSSFIQSGGTFNIDPNSGSVGTSVGSSTTSLLFNNASHSVTGGKIVIVDPNFNAGTAKAVDYNISTTSNAWSTSHTLEIGDGTAGNGSSNTSGFILESYTGTGRLTYGNLRIRAGGTNRWTSLGAWSINVRGTLTVDAGAEIRLSSASTGPVFAGDIVNDGTITSTVTTIFANTSGSSVVANNTPQNISGAGVFRNLTTTPTANWTSMTINNSQPVTFNANAITGTGTGSVSSTLTLTLGVLNTSGNTFTVGTSGSSAGTLTGGTSTSYINGTLKRWVTAAILSRLYPIGTASTYYGATINFTAAPTTAGSITAQFISGDAGSSGLPLVDGTGSKPYANTLCTTGYWQIDAGNSLAGGTYTANMIATGFSCVDDFTATRLLKRPTGGGNWTLAGTFVTGTGSNGVPTVNRSGNTGFSQFAISQGQLNPLPVELTSFIGQTRDKANMLKWSAESELNFDKYILERAPEVREELFSPVTEVEGKGSVTQAASYEYMDEQPLPLSYYRLKMMDTDGTYEYSKIIVLENGKVGLGDVKAFPVPSSDLVYVTFNATDANDYRLILTDISGRVISNDVYEGADGFNQTNVSLANYPSGVYYLSIVGGQVNRNIQLVKE